MEVTALEKLVEYYRENKISHAYLLETNNLEQCFNDLKVVIKKIFCQNEFKDNCTNCNICNLINQNYLPSLVVIEPDGTMIKKEQILNLKQTFSSVPVFTNENIYIIKEAEKLNAASANTMLKFIEEPEDHIIGFFITDSINKVLPTIRSRCEVLKVIYDASSLNVYNLDGHLLAIACEYIQKIEVEKKEGIMYNKDVILSNLTERDEILSLFQIILLIYDEALKAKINIKNDFEKFNGLAFLLDLSYEQLVKRVNLLTTFLDDITSNVNKELLLDKFIIELSDIND